jgi:hypothetical protein
LIAAILATIPDILTKAHKIMFISALFLCPVCGTENEIEVDPSAGSRQKLTEDCQTCCRPLVLSIEITPDGDDADVEATPENE